MATVRTKHEHRKPNSRLLRKRKEHAFILSPAGDALVFSSGAWVREFAPHVIPCPIPLNWELPLYGDFQSERGLIVYGLREGANEEMGSREFIEMFGEIL